MVDARAEFEERELNMGEAMEKIRAKYPNFDPSKSPFIAKIDDFGQVFVQLIRKGNVKYHKFFGSNGEVHSKLPKTITDALGPKVEDVVMANEDKIKSTKEKIFKGVKRIKQLFTKRETETPENRAAIDGKIND